MARLTIEISEAAWQRLRGFALLERRSPRDQAAVMLERALGVRAPETRRGALDQEDETPD